MITACSNIVNTVMESKSYLAGAHFAAGRRSGGVERVLCSHVQRVKVLFFGPICISAEKGFDPVTCRQADPAILP